METISEPPTPLSPPSLPCNTSSNNKKKRKKVASSIPLPCIPPDGWDRCHFYLERKGRFCRQEVLHTKQHNYCGNHQHHHLTNQIDSSTLQPTDHQHDINNHSCTTSSRTIRKRIACPIDPTHHIYEDMVEQHIEKCPKTIELRNQQQQSFYCHHCNGGGSGRLFYASSRNDNHNHNHDINANRNDLEWAKRVARTVLDTYRRVFPITTSTTSTTSTTATTVSPHNNNNSNYTNRCINRSTTTMTAMTATTTGGTTGIPLMDLSSPELEAGFVSAITNYRMKSGGHRHIQQQASMIGHLRRIGIVPPLVLLPPIDSSSSSSDCEMTKFHPPTENDHDTIVANDITTSSLSSTSTSRCRRTILEMGAGRGMTGLVIAGVASAAMDSQKEQIQLTMIERSASRSRAEKCIRKAQQQPQRNLNHFDDAVSPTYTTTTTEYMNLSNVQWNRIQCDLSHVNIKTILTPTAETATSSTTTIDIVDHENFNNNKGIQQTPPTTTIRHHNKNDIVVIAKHLCGAGTDIALKSLEPIREDVTAVIMSTCCHGVCDWNEYVGRDYLIDAMLDTPGSTSNSTVSSDDDDESKLSTFGKDEFDLLRLWSSGTVRNVTDLSKKGTNDDDDKSKLDDEHCAGDLKTTTDGHKNDDDHHHTFDEMNNDHSNNNRFTNVTTIVESLPVPYSGGVQGFGRTCQRLIDYGRCEYLRHVIFANPTTTSTTTATPTDRTMVATTTTTTTNNNNNHVELVYYVPESISPQNALLLAYRN